MSSFYTNDLDSSDNIKYDYDLIIIGGGSGGLSCSKAAAKHGKTVCVLDYVKPSLHGTTWGLGGTCVNVGCMPKKQFHYASLIHEIISKDAHMYGYFDANQQHLKPTFQWSHLVESVQDQIRSSNFKYRVELREKNVKYENYHGTFLDSHTLELTNTLLDRPPKQITARRFVIAVGGRPQPLECIGGQYAITSDDIFSLENAPGKTLVIGGSYVALECAGFLAGLGCSTTLMIRSILLRGFDQEMANKIGDYMDTESGVKFLKQCVPYSIEKLDNGKFKVQWCSSGGEQITAKNLKDVNIVGEDIFDTILNATGRYADIQHLGISSIGVKINPATGHILAKNEQTSVPHIYAIGDVVDGVPELTPPAILAGKLLAERLYNNGRHTMDYTNIPTTIFTPIEYGCIGFTEDDAYKKYGENNVTVYHQYFTPLEWSLSQERKLASKCYIKVLCLKNEKERIVGFHYLGPNAGEVTQGVGVAMKLSVTYQQLVDTVGIHPTTAEIMTLINITKESGEDPNPKGCCG